MNKIFFTTVLLSLIAVSGFSQSQPDSSEHYSLLGIHLLLSDYNSPYFNRFNPGYQISYFDRLSRKLNFMVHAGSTGADNAFKQSIAIKGLIHNLSGSVLLSVIQRQRSVNPFLTAGAGLNFSSPYLIPSLHTGAGLQVRLNKNTHLHIQANYQVSLAHRMNNSVQLNLGILGAIFQTRKRFLTAPSEPVEINPLIADTDNDGTPDYADSCVSVPGPRAFNGCPDSDGDGIPDYKDLCRTVPGPAANNGCPIALNDRDRDGVPDETDKCPDLRGSTLNNGCPVISDEIKQRLKRIIANINFDVNKAELTLSTQNSLKELLLILKNDPALLLTVSGHTDNTGTSLKNQKLSEMRASAVVNYIIANGIASDRLTAIGYGDTKPIADNTTNEGRAVNRRTELTLKYPYY